MKSQALPPEFEVLKNIYALYDEAIGEVDKVCKKGCAACCTCNVTMTSLEADYLVASLSEKAKEELKEIIENDFPKKRYSPEMTTNQFARWCMEGKDVTEEENDPAWGRCPVLKEDMCTVYDGRPFGCRALMSQTDCGKKGYAQLPPEVMTINNVFMQVIEHADQNGISGNFSDVMQLFLTQEVERIDSRVFAAGHKEKKLLLNEKIPVLMIPPEHRPKLAPLIEKLSGILKSISNEQ